MAIGIGIAFGSGADVIEHITDNDIEAAWARAAIQEQEKNNNGRRY